MGCVSSKAKRPSVIHDRSSGNLHSEPSGFIKQNNMKFIDVYELGASLGKGAFGEVRVVTHKITNAQRAVKILPKDSDSQRETKEFLNEVNMMRMIDHPNIVRMYEYFDTPRKSYLVMELCKGGELFEELLKRSTFNEDDAACIMKQLFSAVKYLHDKKIAHRDLKPQNMLLENKGDITSVKISDFGTATLSEKHHKSVGIIGTALFLAPEVVAGQYDLKCDLWSCGVILYLLLSGRTPFDGNNNDEIFAEITKCELKFEDQYWSHISSQAKDLISELICPAKFRLSAQDCLEHAWITRSSASSQNPHAMQTTLSALQTYQKKSKLKDAITSFLTSQIATSEETKELRQVFVSIDSNGDGKLSKKELMTKYLEMMGENEAKSEVKRIMKEVDTDKSGYIDYNEFIKATFNSQMLISKENLRAAFNVFDTDKSGTINAAELRNILCNGKSTPDSVWNEILREADSNGNGEIDLKEFESIVMNKL